MPVRKGKSKKVVVEPVVVEPVVEAKKEVVNEKVESVVEKKVETKAAKKALASESTIDETARTVKLKNGLVVSMSYYLKNKAKLEV